MLAKIHEITIQASLASVIFSYIRIEFTSGHGLPFGALFSGTSLNQIAYLGSMEFWGTIRADNLSVRRKLNIVTLTFICIVLATVSRPVSAVLLIPRLGYWSAGTTDIWLNATFDDLYPTL